jgi:hypothetical protein
VNEEEIQEALKVIKEPITVNSIEYKYFDQENYEKLLRVYENCQWFISNAEQFIQNFKNQQQELDQNKNNWEELKKLLNEMILDTKKPTVLNNREKMAIRSAIEHILNKMKELEENN